MKIRRFFMNVLLLVVFAGVVFFIGWIQFLVKPGNVGVMESKTSGLLESPVLPGEFLWRWERLLPTNVTLHLFSAAPFESRQTVTGELPSASLYSAQLDPQPDFSYRLEAVVTLSVQPETLVLLVGGHTVSDDQSLRSWLDAKAKVVASAAADYLIAHNSADFVMPASLTPAQLAEVHAAAAAGMDGVSIDAVELVRVRIPDAELYARAKEAYASYQDAVSSLLAERAAEQAASIAEEDRTMAQLEKFGSLLSRYPQLDELSKQGGITDIIAALRAGSL